MVFTKRNRSYGAYILRKEYPSALVAAFVFMGVVMMLLFASPLIIRIARNLTSSNTKVQKVIYVIEPPAEPAKQSQKVELKKNDH